ncbi:RING-H2 finger protein ATL57-like [Hevea brasiliensis]|uniref:RING-H2 finger protein ATL57-like n=1 Tax=Hevea brasiliensis TaxID=3981 RepID=UPI0025F73C34|nr:RING-H2 finger protein ATL57-like [Hevea brasiliensis]
MAFLVTSQPSMKSHSRKLQVSYNTSFQPLNTLHNSTSASPPPPLKKPIIMSPPPPPPTPQPSSQQQYSHPPFDSSMALTVLVLLAALFFMGFFSIYLRKFSTDPTPDFSSHRRNNPTTPVRQSRAASGSSKGLDPQVIRSLPVYSYYHEDAKYQIECAICLGEFEEKDTVKIIPYCKHVFHLECIDTWLKMHVTCPVCRGIRFLEMNSKSSSDGYGGGLVSTVENGDMCIQVGTLGMTTTDS